MRRTLVITLLAALLLPACELRLANDVRVGPDGGGSIELHVAVDDELHELLVEAGLDPLLGLDQLRRAAPEWTIEELAGEGDGLSLSLRTTFDDPREFAALTDGLHGALDDQDGALWDELRITVDDADVRFAGRAGLVVPRFPGADGDVAFDEDDLARLVRERGEEFVRYDLRVTLPGEVRSTDADQVTGATVVWHLPVGELRDVSAAAELVTAGTPLLLTAIALLVATGTAVSIVAVRARRSSRRRRAARPRVDAG